MGNKAKRMLLIMFALVFAVLVGFAMDSYAKYVISSSERLEGQYTDFRLSHDGQNKSIILEEVSDTDYTHVGYVTINLSNEDEEGNISQRDILFNFVSCSTDQITAGKIVDSWGEETALLYDHTNNGYFADYYDIEVVDEVGNPIDSFDEESGRPVKDSDLYNQNNLAAMTLNTTSVMLKIERRKLKRSDGSAVPSLATNSVESLDLLLKTFIPYIDLKVLQLNLTSSLVYISTFEDDYFQAPQVNVNIKSSINYSLKVLEGDKTNTYKTALPVKLVFTFDSNKLLFDYERFRLSVENNYKQLSDSELSSYTIGYHYSNTDNTDTLTLFIPAASDVDLYFYIMQDTGGKINLTTSLFKYTNSQSTEVEYNYLSEVSGLTSTGSPRLVYSN